VGAEHEQAPHETADAARQARSPDAGSTVGTAQGLALALQQGAGNAATVRMLARWPVLTGIDQAERYKAGRAAYEQFVSTGPRKKESFGPSTGSGVFDVELDPPLLILTVKCKFQYVPGSAAQFPKAKPEDLTWKKGEPETFEKAWFQAVNDFWKGGIFKFNCQRTGWEDLRAIVLPVFAPVDDKPHYTCTISKTPPGAGSFFRSDVTRATWTVSGGGKVETSHSGSASFGSRDLEYFKKPGGKQRTAVHEAGHMLGLGDEYIDTAVGHTAGKEASHSKLVEKQLGYKVVYGDTESIMSGGEKVLEQHSVTFREALEAVSGITEWSLQPKLPNPGIDPNTVEPTPVPSGKSAPA
jgi:hypothetical protein